MSEDKNLQGENVNSENVDFDSLFDELDIETWGVESFGESVKISGAAMHADAK